MNYLSRYSRQILVEHFGPEGQQKLLNAKVLVIGAGGLGCPILTYLASAGVGVIGVLDFDRIEESNLARQPLYTMEDIGKYKAEIAGEYLKKLNSGIKVQTITQKLNSENALEFISQYDIVADACDNFTTRYIINDACVKANKPWVFGSIQGWEGQVSVFNYHNGPAYRDLYPEPPANDDAPTCDDIGVIATLPAVMGSYQANEIIKCIIGSEKTLSGKLLIMDLYSNTHNLLNIKGNKNLDNPKPHSRDASEGIEISLEEYLQNPSGYQLIDIRQGHEFDEYNIGGKNIPYQDLISDSSLLDKEGKYAIICYRGRISKVLMNFLIEKHGFTHLKSLIGGIEAAQKLKD